MRRTPNMSTKKTHATLMVDELRSAIAVAVAAITLAAARRCHDHLLPIPLDGSEGHLARAQTALRVPKREPSRFSLRNVATRHTRRATRHRTLPAPNAEQSCPESTCYVSLMISNHSLDALNDNALLSQ